MGHLRQHKHFLLQFVNFSCTNFVEKLPFSIMALNEKAAKDRKLEKDKCTSYRETNWPEFELWKLLHNFISQNCSSIWLYLTINAAPPSSRLYLYELSHDNFCQHQGSNKICPYFVGFSCNIMGSGPYPILNSELTISILAFKISYVRKSWKCQSNYG